MLPGKSCMQMNLRRKEQKKEKEKGDEAIFVTHSLNTHLVLLSKYSGPWTHVSPISSTELTNY